MEIYITEQGKSVTEAEFKELHPETSFPPVLAAELLTDLGAEPVMETPQPTPGPFQTVARNGTTIQNGKRVMAWKISNWSAPEIAAYKAAAKEAKWEAIKAERERRKAGGVQVGGNWFHTDDPSRIQHLGLVMMGANIPAGLQWKTLVRNADGSPIFATMTQALAFQIFMAVGALDQTAFAAAEQHRAAMEAATDPGAYDFSAGWPPIFQG